MKTITQTLFQKMNIVSNDFSFYPKIEEGNITEQQKYDLQWFAIGKEDTLRTNTPYKATIKGKEYVYWKKSNGFLNAVTSKCPIDNSDLCNGNILPTENGIECTQGHVYNSYDFSRLHNIDSFDIAKKNGWVYMNTYGYNNKDRNIIREFHAEEDIDNTVNTLRFFETESFLSADALIANIVDVGHFTLHYLFGNVYSEKYVYKEVVNNIGPFHTQMRRVYQCDKSTVASKLVNIDNAIIQNDLFLPYTASTKIIMGDKFVTLTCSCLPVKKNKTKIFMKVYHNIQGKLKNDFVDKLLRLMTVLLDTWTMAHTKSTRLWDTLSSKYK
jgi:hypothetical protein